MLLLTFKIALYWSLYLSTHTLASVFFPLPNFNLDLLTQGSLLFSYNGSFYQYFREPSVTGWVSQFSYSSIWKTVLTVESIGQRKDVTLCVSGVS